MASNGTKPEIFWVVGEGTDVGKTTVTAALTRLLNRHGRRTVAFKPYTLSRLWSSIDFLVREYPPHKEKLSGSDAHLLSLSSPHTNADMTELITPCNAFAFPGWTFKVLMRAGSSETGNVRYFTSARAKELLKRPDFQRLTERVFLPMDRAEVISEETMNRAPALFPEVKSQAFRHLAETKPESMVFEGAGRLLPVWRGSPLVNHIFVLEDGRMTFYRNIDRHFQPRASVVMVSLTSLKSYLAGSSAGKIAQDHLMAENDLVDTVTEATLESVLKESGYLG
jgi:hypothetical protein